MQLANKTKERGSVLAQIERERVLVSDLKAKFEKHTETLTELMERKYSLQRESEELEALSAAVDPLAPGPPQGPSQWGLGSLSLGLRLLLRKFPEIKRGMMKPWNRVLSLPLVLESVLISRPNVSLSRHLLSSVCWEKSAFSRGRRSSLIARAASLSTQDLVLLQEQVTALSNSRQNEDKNEVQVVAEQESDISAAELEPSASLE